MEGSQYKGTKVKRELRHVVNLFLNVMIIRKKRESESLFLMNITSKHEEGDKDYEYSRLDITTTIFVYCSIMDMVVLGIIQYPLLDDRFKETFKD